MSIQLKLDSSAVASLFPEGSEIRLELQQAVINETVRKIVDRELSQTRRLIADQCKLVVEQVLSREGLSSSLWKGVKLSDDFQKRLESQARELASNAINASLVSALQPYIVDMDARIAKAMDANMRVHMQTLAKEALRAALK